MRTTTKITLIAAACLTAAGLAGCSTTSGTASTPASTPKTTTAPVTSPSPTDQTSSSPTTSTSASPSTGSAITACTSAHLSAAISPSAGGGAAGSTYVNLVLTNKGTVTCTLQGWPGVSFVGDGNGTQIGQAAVFDRASPHATVTVAPGATATSVLRIVQAGNYSSADCKPTPADGFRVYPPGQKASVFAAKSGLTACASKTVSLLTVSGLK
jgi:hypothetical protein